METEWHHHVMADMEECDRETIDAVFKTRSGKASATMRECDCMIFGT